MTFNDEIEMSYKLRFLVLHLGCEWYASGKLLFLGIMEAANHIMQVMVPSGYG